MSAMANYLLHLVTLSDDAETQNAIEWVIISGHIRLTYNRERDEKRILSELPAIVQAYRSYAHAMEQPIAA